MRSGESAGNNSNEGLSDMPLSHHSSFSQPTPPVTASFPSKSVHLRVLSDPDFCTETELQPVETIIPKDLLRKLKPKEKKRQEVINGSLCSQFLLSCSVNSVLCALL